MKILTDSMMWLLVAMVLGAGACGDDGAQDDVDGDVSEADTATDTAVANDTADADDAVHNDSTEPDALADTVAEDVDPTTDVVAGAACDEGTRVGKFEVGHWGFYSAITGEIANGVIPLTVLQEVASEGSCRLMQKTNPFCNPPCSAGELCDHDSTCIAYPTNLGAGDVTITGLAESVVLEPNAVDTYSTTDVPLPLFAPGAAIALSAAGGDGVTGFELSAFGVPDLVVPQDEIELARDTSLTLAWDAIPAAWRMTVAVNIDQHGNSPVTLICDVSESEVDGSITVPASLINQLLDFGVSGFASYDLQRVTTDAAELAPGCVELRVFSHATGRLKVAGHVACNADPDCPDGMTCQVAINTCVPE